MDFSEKKTRIEKITDEVNELHPLLGNTLPKLPNVKSWEYTHGQFERGADFIIEVENATTGRRSHIGVVVKCGKIGGGKVTDVEEQIKECSEERAYKVMQRVRCSEVWVFSSGGYSERAKEKLQDRFPGRSVEFFGPEDIASYVDNHFSFFWDDLPHEVGTYFQQLRNKLEALDSATSLVDGSTNGSVYIDLDTYERINKKYTNSGTNKPSSKTIDFLKEACSTEFGLLEAEMGFGKSRLARRLALVLCSPDSFRKTNLLPVFSTYRNFLDGSSGNLETLVKNSLGAANHLVGKEKTQVLVILDGIDECSSPTTTSTVLFEKLREELRTLRDYRVIVTSRPLKSLVDRAAMYNEARTFGIRPLSLAKIISYLETTCKKTNLPSRLFEDLKRSPLFKQLPHSPIAAALFSNLLAQKQQEVPQSLTELYAKSVELMLGRWDQKKDMTTEKHFKTSQLIAEQLACYYIENKLVYLGRDEVTKFIASYLEKRNTGVELDSVFQILLNRSNIFTIDEDNDTIAFRHRSFAEYLCAHKRSKDRSISVRDSALNPYWINVFYFYVGTLLDCPEVLSELRATKANDETEEWMQLISVPSYLLAAYQTEFDQVENNLKVVLIEAAKLYLRVKEGNTRTKLTELSEMHLLYLFKSIVVESLGYHFFNKGFESVALQIADELEDQDVKSHALFFLACAALHCSNDFGFKFIIETIGAGKLPLAVSLAIRCELETNTSVNNSKLLKHHKDKLHRLFSAGKSKGGSAKRNSDQSRITDLFEKPLSVRKNSSPLKLAK
jgi:uncharacterized protein (DUF2164 family)